MTAQTLRLPWPPSVNTYWRHGRGRTYISENGKRYREIVFVRTVRLLPYCQQRVAVEIMAFPPDRRKRDLDNLLKALLDSLENAKAFDDDSQIDDLRICRMPPDPDKQGYVLVTIDVIGSED